MNRTIKGRQAHATAFAIGALLAASAGLHAQARGPDCSKLVVNQSYAYAFQGYLNIPQYFTANHLGDPPAGAGVVPNAGSGIFTFLPGGKVSGRITLSVGLLAVQQGMSIDPEKSTYMLALDTTRTPNTCSGVLHAVATGASDEFQLLVSADGQHIEMVSTFAGLVVPMSGTRVDASKCTNRTIEGDYVYNIRGWGLAGGPFTFATNQLLGGYFPFAFSGGMRFRSVQFPRSSDPGTVAFWDTVSANGTMYPRTGSGSYSLKPDCTGMLTLTDSTGVGFHLELIVDQKSGDIYLVNVDTAPGMPIPGFIVGATMSRAAQE